MTFANKIVIEINWVDIKAKDESELHSNQFQFEWDKSSSFSHFSILFFLNAKVFFCPHQMSILGAAGKGGKNSFLHFSMHGEKQFEEIKIFMRFSFTVFPWMECVGVGGKDLNWNFYCLKVGAVERSVGFEFSAFLSIQGFRYIFMKVEAWKKEQNLNFNVFLTDLLICINFHECGDFSGMQQNSNLRVWWPSPRFLLIFKNDKTCQECNKFKPNDLHDRSFGLWEFI